MFFFVKIGWRDGRGNRYMGRWVDTKEQYRESGGDETVCLDCSSGYTNVHMCLNCMELRRHIWSQVSVCKTSEI